MLKRISTPLFDEFEEAMEGIRGRHVLVQRSHSGWDLDVLAFGDVALMHGRNGARSVYQGTCDPGTCIVFLPLENRAGLSLNGYGLEGGGEGAHRVAMKIACRPGPAYDGLRCPCDRQRSRRCATTHPCSRRM